VHKTALELGVDRSTSSAATLSGRSKCLTPISEGNLRIRAFDSLLGKAMKAIDWTGFEARKADAAQRGMLWDTESPTMSR